MAATLTSLIAEIDAIQSAITDLVGKVGTGNVAPLDIRSHLATIALRVDELGANLEDLRGSVT